MNNISDNWKNINLKFYLKYVEYQFAMNKDLNDTDKEFSLLGFCDGKSLKTMRQLPMFELDLIRERWNFLAEDILKAEPLNLLNIGEEIYHINKDFNQLSFDKWENIDAFLKASDDGNFMKNIHNILAILIQPNESYDYFKVDELGKEILELPMYYIIPNISFFLSEEQSSLENIHSYLIQQEAEQITKLEALLNKKPNSMTSSVGIQPSTNWRTKILLKIVSFWLKRYKKYLRISFT